MLARKTRRVGSSGFWSGVEGARKKRKEKKNEGIATHDTEKKLGRSRGFRASSGRFRFRDVEKSFAPTRSAR